MIIEKIKKADKYINAHWKTFLFFVLLLQAFGLVSFFLYKGVIIDGDSPDYIIPAISFICSGQMLDAFGAPILLRTPGYPFILALIYSCTGSSNTAVIIIQILMTILITLMIFSIVSYFFSKSMAVIASFFYVMDFAIYALSSSILTDIPFSFCVTLAIYLLVQYINKKKNTHLFLCFITLNVAMLIRPTIMYLNFIILIVLIFLSLMKKISWKKMMVFLLLFLITFGGWSLRNESYYGKFIYTTIRDDSTFIYYAPLLYAQEEKCSDKEAYEFFSNELEEKYPEFDTMDPITQVEARKEIGSSYIKSHLLGYIKMNVKGLFNEMLGPNAYQINSLPLPKIIKSLLMVTVMGMLFLAYLIYAIGFFTNIRKCTWLDWVLLLSTMYFMASTAVLGYSRFRMAFYPICLIGAFICWRNRKKKPRNS